MIRRLLTTVLALVVGFSCSSSAPNERGSGTPAGQMPGQDPESTGPPESGGTRARKVAVLIAAEYSTAPLPGNEEFWYDTVLTYCMLRQNGFKDEEIYVLYGYGNDGFYTLEGQNTTEVVTVTSDSGVDLVPEDYYVKPYCGGLDLGTGIGPLSVDKQITDFSMAYDDQLFGCKGARCLPQEIFECLAKGCDPRSTFNAPSYPADKIEKLDEDDFLFVWWKGHGYELYLDSGVEHYLGLGGNPLTPRQINGWMKAIGAGQQLLVFETCHSGCLVDDMGPNQANEPATLFLVSSECQETSTRSIQHEFGIRHGVWSYWVAGTLQGELPPFGANPIYPNSSDPLLVELSLGGPLSDTFSESEKATFREARDADGNATQHPVMRDVSPSLAPKMHINIEDPVGHAASVSPQEGGRNQ